MANRYAIPITIGSISGHLLPSADDTYDIGSATAAWQDLFLEGDITLTDAGTISCAGDLTISPTGNLVSGERLLLDGAGSPSLVQNAMKIQLSGQGTGFEGIYMANDGGTYIIALESSGGSSTLGGGTSYAATIGTVGSRNLEFGTANNIRLKMDTSGNLALQQGSTISTTAGALTLDPATVVNLTLTANTSSALATTDGSATYHAIDTRTGTVGVYAHKFDTANPTLASAGNAIFQLIEFSAFTLTLTGTTQVTSKQSHINIEAMTITDTSSVTVDIASTLRIAGAPGEGGSVTIDAAYALYVDAGDTRMDGALMVGAPSGGMKTAGTINAVAVYDDNSILTDWVFEEYYGKGMELTRS